MTQLAMVSLDSLLPSNHPYRRFQASVLDAREAFADAIHVKGSWPLFRESLDILLESPPPHVTTSKIVATIEPVPGVKKIHDLHIWSVEPCIVMLTCHVLVDSHTVPDKDQLLHSIQSILSSKFYIHHLTLQLETECPETEDLHCNLSYLTNRLSAREPVVPHLHHH